MTTKFLAQKGTRVPQLMSWTGHGCSYDGVQATQQWTVLWNVLLLLDEAIGVVKLCLKRWHEEKMAWGKNGLEIAIGLSFPITGINMKEQI